VAFALAGSDARRVEVKVMSMPEADLEMRRSGKIQDPTRKDHVDEFLNSWKDGNLGKRPDFQLKMERLTGNSTPQVV
jgi:hypothetical protein